MKEWKQKFIQLRCLICSFIKKLIAPRGLRNILVGHEKKISVDEFGKIFIDLNNIESRKALQEKIDSIREVELP
ncbi:hypothetical protein QWY97_20345 [Vibrio cortegadensis]|uniref:hypothetical protein n=1 Tax=Vibrio cortegadensis TaxID=1328770 RepID=UPI0021C3FA10|nr:hypothetical protein [Vibrio cortegadensis]MDN3699659.1 hypothetical protein [Vibrio cortegadensis]